MKHRTNLALSAMTVLCLGFASPSTAVAQTAKDLVGAWTLISSDTVRPDGIKIPTFGDDPKGIIIFTSDGRFIYLLSRSDLPKFASNNRNTGSLEENKAVVQGSIATFGTYSVAGTSWPATEMLSPIRDHRRSRSGVQLRWREVVELGLFMSGVRIWTEKQRMLFSVLRHKNGLARPERFELPTTWFEARCSIQLSYGRPRAV